MTETGQQAIPNIEKLVEDAVAVGDTEAIMRAVSPMGTAEVSEFLGVPKPNVRKLLEARGVNARELRLGPVWPRGIIELVKVDYDAEKARRQAEERPREPRPEPRDREVSRSGPTQQQLLRDLLDGQKTTSDFAGIEPEVARLALLRLDGRGLVRLTDTRRGKRTYKLTTKGRRVAQELDVEPSTD